MIITKTKQKAFLALNENGEVVVLPELPKKGLAIEFDTFTNKEFMEAAKVMKGTYDNAKSIGEDSNVDELIDPKVIEYFKGIVKKIHNVDADIESFQPIDIWLFLNAALNASRLTEEDTLFLSSASTEKQKAKTGSIQKK